MSIVSLVSGGLDSTVMALLAEEEGLTQFPLFIDYGQRGRDLELEACRANFEKHHLPPPTVASLGGFGRLVPSGLTDCELDVLDDAFTPGRNALFLTVAAAYAHRCAATSLAIGLLDERHSLFPDQTRTFLADAQVFLSGALGVSLRVVAPLMSLTKADVMRVAKAKGITGTYSCHAGFELPCGICIACREYLGLEI